MIKWHDTAVVLSHPANNTINTMATRQLEYWGEFGDKLGRAVRVEISRLTDTTLVSSEVTFPADEPLVICWGNTERHEPIKSSSATLRLISDTDRRFINLYTTDPRAIRLDVKIDGQHYWQGCLDTERYEEPYSRLEDYEVMLTFSDFGPLSRTGWSHTGVIDLDFFIYKCMRACGMDELPERFDRLSLTSDEYSFSHEDTYIVCDNFFDADNRPMTMKQALSGVLQGLGLGIIQRHAAIYVFDLNGLYGTTPLHVEWMSDDAMLSASEVYNNIKVTFSPYDDPELYKGEVDYGSAASDDATGFTIQTPTGLFVRVAYDVARIFVGAQGQANYTIDNGAQYGRIEPILLGDKTTAVIWTLKDQLSGTLQKNTLAACDCYVNNTLDTLPIITSRAVWCGGEDVFGQSKQLLVNLDLLFDVRLIPFGDDIITNSDNTGWMLLHKFVNFAYVPIKLQIKDRAGNVLYHYYNDHIRRSGGGETTPGERWLPGAARWGHAWLCYYDKDDRTSKSGLGGGWRTNRQTIGRYHKNLPVIMRLREDGEWITLPPVCGWLELQIGRGVNCSRYDDRGLPIYHMVTYLAYRNPSIRIVDGPKAKTAENKDIEYNASLDSDAREELSIDTILGSPDGCLPSAKGLYVTYDNDTIVPYTSFRRNNLRGPAHQMLLNTLYSQYATRHPVISGTVKILSDDDWQSLAEASTEGRFMMIADRQDLRESVSEIKMIEIFPDTYQATD